MLIGVFNKNNLHLSESSKIILQNFGYDIQFLKKIVSIMKKLFLIFILKSMQIERNVVKIKDMFKKYDIKET